MYPLQNHPRPPGPTPPKGALVKNFFPTGPTPVPVQQATVARPVSSVIKQQPASAMIQPALTLLRDIQRLYDTREQTGNLPLIINGQVYKCHRDLFFCRTRGGEVNTEYRGNWTPEMVSALIRWVYTDGIELNDKNVIGILTLAELFKMPVLVEHCMTYLQRVVTGKNLFTWIKEIMRFPECKLYNLFVANGYIKPDIERLKLFLRAIPNGFFNYALALQVLNTIPEADRRPEIAKEILSLIDFSLIRAQVLVTMVYDADLWGRPFGLQLEELQINLMDSVMKSQANPLKKYYAESPPPHIIRSIREQEPSGKVTVPIASVDLLGINSFQFDCFGRTHLVRALIKAPNRFLCQRTGSEEVNPNIQPLNFDSHTVMHDLKITINRNPGGQT